jgi:hypothetical protein
MISDFAQRFIAQFIFVCDTEYSVLYRIAMSDMMMMRKAMLFV